MESCGYLRVIDSVARCSLVIHHRFIKQHGNLATNGINIVRIEIIIIQCISDEVVNQIPLIFSEQFAIDCLGKVLVCHRWLCLYYWDTLSGPVFVINLQSVQDSIAKLLQLVVGHYTCPGQNP
jgi:hypothetical protein